MSEVHIKAIRCDSCGFVVEMVPVGGIPVTRSLLARKKGWVSMASRTSDEPLDFCRRCKSQRDKLRLFDR